MRKSCLQSPETLVIVFFFFLEDNILFRKGYVYLCVYACVCVCAHAGFTLFDYVIDLKHGVLSTFFLMIGLKNIDVINLSHFPAIPFIFMPSFRSSFPLSYWKFQVKLVTLKESL